MKYPIIKGMPVVPSTYWPMVHGANAADADQDLEGLQVMRNLGHNMAWMLKCIALGQEQRRCRSPRLRLPRRERTSCGRGEDGLTSLLG